MSILDDSIIVDGCVWSGCDNDADRVVIHAPGSFSGVCADHPNPPSYFIPIAPCGVVAKVIRWPNPVRLSLPQGWAIDVDHSGEGMKWLRYKMVRQELHALVRNPVPEAVLFIASTDDGIALILGWADGEEVAACPTVERGGRVRHVVPFSLLNEGVPAR